MSGPSYRTDFNEVRLCPRCRIENLPIGYPGALSRADNATEVCSNCGLDEALTNFAGFPAQSPDAWPVKRLRSYPPKEAR